MLGHGAASGAATTPPDHQAGDEGHSVRPMGTTTVAVIVSVTKNSAGDRADRLPPSSPRPSSVELTIRPPAAAADRIEQAAAETKGATWLGGGAAAGGRGWIAYPSQHAQCATDLR